MEKLLLLVPEESRDAVLEKYTLNTEKDPAVYEQKRLSGKEQEDLNGILEKPIFLVYMLESGQVEGMPGEITPEILQGMEAQGISLDQVMDELDQKLGEMEGSILTQSDILYVQQEYEALGVDVGAIQIQYIVITGLKMLGLALAAMLATIIVTLLASRTAAGVAKNLRNDVFQKVVSFSNQEFEKFSTASLITRSTNDIQQIQMLLVLLLRIVFYAPIVAVGGCVMALQKNSSMFWVIGVAVVAVLSLVVVLFSITMPRFKLMQKLVDKLNLVSREILSGLWVIRAFGTQKYEEKRFDGVNRDLTKTNLFVNRVMTCMMPAMMLTMNAVTVLIVWVGADKINAGGMQVGDLMAFIQYTMQIVMSFLMISMMSIMLPRATVSANRIQEVLETEVEIADPARPEGFVPSKTGEVEFQDVSFRYPGADEDVLENITFTAKKGETTAFIGSTGSGKSTLINLIPRFYDVTKGRILVNGRDVRDVTQHELRARIGYVPQRGVLFSGTIESNLKYGGDSISNRDMEQAAQIAQATEFIGAKPDGYQSEISQGGGNVSGGQKQRLSIARAIAKHPEIYIFDDSFSALDYKTDVALRKELKEKTAGATVLIVAQRISTILHAEQIIVLDEGKIVGKGTHEELLQSCEVYQQIALSQLSKEELGK
ncbi:MAG: ABC transporter ATP-binding protein [[Clostridium] leptum]